MQQQTAILPLCLLMIPLSGVGTDLYTASLPAIIHALHASSFSVKLSLAMYLFGLGAGGLLIGGLSDRHGRKPLLTASLLAFILSSAAVLCLPHIVTLLIARLIQGAAAAGPSVLCKAMLNDTLEGPSLKRAMIYIVTIWGLSPIIAPVIGGALQHHFGWRANFYGFMVYGSLLLCASTGIRETLHHALRQTTASLISGYRPLMTHPNYWATILCMGLTYSAIMCFNVIAPFFVQVTLQYNALVFGQVAMGIGLAFVLGSYTNRWLMHHFHSKQVNGCCTTTMLATVLTLPVLSHWTTASLATLIIPSAMLIFLAGVLQPNMMAQMLSFFPNDAGKAAAGSGAVICILSGLVTTLISKVHIANLLPLYLSLGLIFSLCALLYRVGVHSTIRPRP